MQEQIEILKKHVADFVHENRHLRAELEQLKNRIAIARNALDMY